MRRLDLNLITKKESSGNPKLSSKRLLMSTKSGLTFQPFCSDTYSSESCTITIIPPQDNSNKIQFGLENHILTIKIFVRVITSSFLFIKLRLNTNN